ncbi:hypothetical protein [Streptomyces griseofuscus]|uniref:hypothetical protein n=1 Tax=Streptomyces griseofuscus TaxID=146922 RepID=UPI0037FF4AC3
MSELFDVVDALVASCSPLPPAQERKRLRLAHGLTLDEVAAALRVCPGRARTPTRCSC